MRRLQSCWLTAACMLVFAGVAFAAEFAVRKDLKVEDLGTPVKRRMANWKVIYRALNGDVHLFAPFCAANGTASDPPSELFDFNLANGDIHHAPGPKGGTYCRPGWVHPNGKVYVTTTRPVTLTEYDPAAGTFRIVGRLAGFYNTIHDVALAPDGILFFGHNGRQLTSYDPKTGKIADHGIMGGGESRTNQFIYTCVADARHVYCAIANHGAWYLVVYDRQEDKQAEYFKPAAGEKSPGRHVWAAVDGKLYYGPDKGKSWQLIDGKPVEVQLKTAVKRKDPSNIWAYNAVNIEKEFGLEIDVSGFTPTNWNDGTVTLKWRKVGDPDWRQATEKGMSVVGNTVRRLAIAPDGTMYGAAAFYGPMFKFNPETGESSYLGPDPGSVYDMLATKERVYMCGYSSFFAVYDPTKPYSVEGERMTRDTKTNPYKLRGPGKRTFRMLEAADGTIYCCGNYSRHDTGADIMYYDPKTGKSVFLRDKVKDYSVGDMCLLDEGKRVVFTLKLLDREKKNTFFLVFDNTTKKIEKMVEVDLGARDDATLFGAGPDAVLVLLQLEDKGHLCRVDLTDGKILMQKDIPGYVFRGPWKDLDFRDIDKRFCVGPDGCGWLFIDNNLSRIHPDGAVERVMEMKQTGQLLFLGNDLYIYNGGRTYFGDFAGVLRIKDVFE